MRPNAATFHGPPAGSDHEGRQLYDDLGIQYDVTAQALAEQEIARLRQRIAELTATDAAG